MSAAKVGATMAGQPGDARESVSSARSASAAIGSPYRVIASSRTRRNHGVFLLGDELATVYSSRRSADSRGVCMSVGCGSLVLTGSMTATQARAMAVALLAAANASEAQGG